jgi:VWFA-related protein
MKTGYGLYSALLGVLLCAPLTGLAQFAQGSSFPESMMPAGIAGSPSAPNAPDSDLYADGTRAINEGRWSDAIGIFTKVARQGSDHADGALYWKAYAENKQGKAKPALKTCVELRRDFPRSRWIDECGALEIEIRARSGEPVLPDAEKDENLKLLALNSLMQKDETRAVAQIREILKSDSSESLKKGAEFILAQGHSKQAGELLAQIAQEKNGPMRSDTASQANTSTALQNVFGGREGPPNPEADGASRRITLDVWVTDKTGKPVTGLDLSDFTLLDNGQPSKILAFRAVDSSAQKAEPPVEVMLLMDATDISIQGTNFMRDQVRKFLLANGGNLAQPVSLFVLYDQGLDILSAPSVDGNALAAKVAGINFGQHKIFDAGAWGGVQRLDLSIGTLTALAKSEGRKPGRKLLLWFGPGWPTFDSRKPPAASRAMQEQWFKQIVLLSTLVRQARVTVYSLLWGTFLPSTVYQEFLDGVKTAGNANSADLTLKVLVVQSGGRILGPDNDLAGEIRDAAQDGSAFYTISFDPPRAKSPNEYHDLKLNIDKPKLTARTSTGYYNQP